MASARATTAAGEGAASGMARAEQSRSSAPPAADSSATAALPPGPRAHPIVQTLAWAFAPTWLMDTCAARVGDSFTITFWPSRFQLALVSDPDAVKKFIADSKPTYPQFEAWIKRQPGVKLDKATIHKLNVAIQGYIHDDATCGGILKASGIADASSVCPDAINLNNLDDWQEFHAAELR